MATYAIGDLQGCYQSLRALLDLVDFDPKHDTLWLVGDLVNRGPDSLSVLRYLYDIQDAVVAVLGNHDIFLLYLYEGFGKPERHPSLLPVLEAFDCDTLMAWLSLNKLCHHQGQTTMFHAGLLPNWRIEQVHALAPEAEFWLTSSKRRQQLFKNIWGDTPTQWHEQLSDWSRLTVIINALTRLRFCTTDGAMDLKCKGTPEKADGRFAPWYQTRDLSQDGLLIVGHWSAAGFRQTPHLIMLDSGCLWGGQLTAFRLEDQHVFSVDCQQ